MIYDCSKLEEIKQKISSRKVMLSDGCTYWKQMIRISLKISSHLYFLPEVLVLREFMYDHGKIIIILLLSRCLC